MCLCLYVCTCVCVYVLKYVHLYVSAQLEKSLSLFLSLSLSLSLSLARATREVPPSLPPSLPGFLTRVVLQGREERGGRVGARELPASLALLNYLQPSQSCSLLHDPIRLALSNMTAYA